MEYFNKIKDALEEKFEISGITVDSSFKDLEIDSLDLVDLIMDLEEELDIEFEDSELLKINTVKDLLDLIDAKK